MSASVAIPRADEWVSGCQAKRIAGLTWYRLHKLTLLGKVRVLAEPGNTLRFNRIDLEQIAQEVLGRAPVENTGETGSDVPSLPKGKTRGADNTGVLKDAREGVTRGGGRRATLSREGYPYVPSV